MRDRLIYLLSVRGNPLLAFTSATEAEQHRNEVYRFFRACNAEPPSVSIERLRVADQAGGGIPEPM